MAKSAERTGGGVGKRQLGFTLVEALIALAIIGIALAGGSQVWTSFVDDTHRSNADQFAKWMVLKQATRMSEIGGYGRRFLDTTSEQWLAMDEAERARFTREEGFVPVSAGDLFGFRCSNPATGNSSCSTNRWAVFLLSSGGSSDTMSNGIKESLRAVCEAGEINPAPSDCSKFADGLETRIFETETVAVPLTERGWESAKGWIFHEPGGRRSVWVPPAGSEFGPAASDLAASLAVGARRSGAGWRCLVGC